MLALMLKRHLPFILSATAAALFLALGAVVVLFGPQRGDARALGDPSAPPPVAAADPLPVGQPPLARPAALPPEAVAAQVGGGGGTPPNLIEARTPDERFTPAALAAVRCAVGRDLAHDPALDAVAVIIWRADAKGELDAMIGRLYQEYQISAFTTIPALANQGADPSDPCVFGGMDLRQVLPRDAWGDAATVGVAFFREQDGPPDFPLSSMVVVGRRAAP
ncbi:MAG: hypothetical protein NZM07_01815 [Elioraea sp.]|nr:hypothetical protein [Elioraea sp.]